MSWNLSEDADPLRICEIGAVFALMLFCRFSKKIGKDWEVEESRVFNRNLGLCVLILEDDGEVEENQCMPRLSSILMSFPKSTEDNFKSPGSVLVIK
jgi:hypothetical protein